MTTSDDFGVDQGDEGQAKGRKSKGGTARRGSEEEKNENDQGVGGNAGDMGEMEDDETGASY